MIFLQFVTEFIKVLSAPFVTKFKNQLRILNAFYFAQYKFQRHFLEVSSTDDDFNFLMRLLVQLFSSGAAHDKSANKKRKFQNVFYYVGCWNLEENHFS